MAKRKRNTTAGLSAKMEANETLFNLLHQHMTDPKFAKKPATQRANIARAMWKEIEELPDAQINAVVGIAKVYADIFSAITVQHYPKWLATRLEVGDNPDALYDMPI